MSEIAGNVIVGAPVTSRAWILPHWFEAVEAQGIPLDYAFIYSPCEDETEKILKKYNSTIIYDTTPPRSELEIDQHMWGNFSGYDYMARMRNQLLETAIDMGADYFFSLDTDILIPAGALTTLLACVKQHGGVVAPALNMAGHANRVAWNVMDWRDPYHPNVATRPEKHFPKSGRADVVMAAMLLDHDGMRCRWSAHKCGEDIGFCLDAVEKGVPRWWLKEVQCQHLMRRMVLS